MQELSRASLARPRLLALTAVAWVRASDDAAPPVPKLLRLLLLLARSPRPAERRWVAPEFQLGC